MNKRQISKFIDSIIPGVKFDFRYGSNFRCQGSPACMDYRCIIWINEDKFFEYKDIEQKGILMHEVGHVLTANVNKEVDAEYCAQLTALSLAKSNGWKRIYDELDKTISGWATDYKWNYQHGQYRRYILAGRRYNGQKSNGKTS